MKFLSWLVFIFISIILFNGCEKDPQGVVDPLSEDENINIIQITIPSVFTYSVEDSSVLISVDVSSSTSLGKLWCEVYDPAGDQLNGNIYLLDDGDVENSGDSTGNDGTYTAEIEFSKSNLNGQYNFDLYYELNSGESDRFARQFISFFNGQANYPPVISGVNLPASVVRDEPFIFSVKAFDANGLNDIPTGGVFYRLFDPSGRMLTNSQGISEFPLSDAGDTAVSGDEIEGDGIFTNDLAFPGSVTAGNWKFEFQAIDRQDSLSNKISRTIIVE
ncbi:MAG: hypothetical protein K9J16_05975 [Melioribacteraceae bacterium]|nr:hypothetical protein [Melioribacteraceae bacterium]MCF8354633.1 hypothetical protein [Melioribacteraceae bacterium]MCF8395021.1 hypothetical protein [Melioribacteraceae bacterium]MCF8418875.1 hypothetical protein [Melioribacteraceae bacterium]